MFQFFCIEVLRRPLLHQTRLVILEYKGREGLCSVENAYEAHELLHKHWHLLNVKFLEVCLAPSWIKYTVDTPGTWSLLKLHGRTKCIVHSRRGDADGRTRHALRARMVRYRLLATIFGWRNLLQRSFSAEGSYLPAIYVG